MGLYTYLKGRTSAPDASACGAGSPIMCSMANNLSLEQFRQELFDIFQKNKEMFERMPNGIFTGFKAEPDKHFTELPEGVIALLGKRNPPWREGLKISSDRRILIL